jgi:branched-chain amino acid transport system permease protein
MRTLFHRPKTLLLAALAVNVVISACSGHFNPYYLDVITGVGINIILAVSLNLINGYTGQFSLGHAGFMAVGAYTSAAITVFWGPRILAATGNGPVPIGLLFLGALVTGGLVAAVAGLAVGVPSLRLKGDYLAIVTLGFGEIIRVIFRNMESVGGALGLTGIPPYTTFFWVFSFAALTTYTVACMVNSTYGRGFIAVHDDEVAAEAMGINTTRYKIIAFVVGAFFAGIAGGIYGHFKLSIDPKGFDFIKSIEIVVMVILGGMGNTVGVIIAAVLLTVLPEALRSFDQYRMILYSLLLIVIMLTRPQGLFTPRKRGLAERKSA